MTAQAARREGEGSALADWARAQVEDALALAARLWAHDWTARARGALVVGLGAALTPTLVSYNPQDPSWNVASTVSPTNWLGAPGAAVADVALQFLGLTAALAGLLLIVNGVQRVREPRPAATRGLLRRRALLGAVAVVLLAGAFALPAPPAAWPFARGLGGLWGDGVLAGLTSLIQLSGVDGARFFAAGALAVLGGVTLALSLGVTLLDVKGALAQFRARGEADAPPPPVAAPQPARKPRPRPAPPPAEAAEEFSSEDDEADEDDGPPFDLDGPALDPKVVAGAPRAPKPSEREARENQTAFEFAEEEGFRLPELAMLAKPQPRQATIDEAALKQNARLLESVLAEFGVRGAIDQIRPGPVVTLYELVPAPGVKSARVVALSDDIARSMSARACRVSVVQGRNAIGIELPNPRRETVYLRDLLSSGEFEKASSVLPMALGETIGGEPYIADLGKMPHLLIAGTTGSGKSVGINAMILSILYRLPPEKCRMIMIDPKMLELSVYDGIPHLLAPVVTDPKKAIVALKWTVREMEDRYRLMSKIGVRNIAGYNEKAQEAIAKGEHFERTVQVGFNEQGRPIYESEKIRPEPMPFIVVVIDEVADLMLVAGKDIEGAVQRLAQMARAAGIHLIMATQRPSVDVITGTIKANFPTRISFQVTSKIDARTILGEQGAEQLLGQGDMLYMAGGGRITRLHGPFVSDAEVETVAAYLRDQGEPQYLEEVTAGGDDDEDGGDDGEFGGSGDDLYDRAVAVVTRDRKASTSYIQRRLQIGYNRAASLMEKMEREGVVGPANHAGKRDILAGPPPA